LHFCLCLSALFHWPLLARPSYGLFFRFTLALPDQNPVTVFGGAPNVLRIDAARSCQTVIYTRVYIDLSNKAKRPTPVEGRTILSQRSIDKRKCCATLKAGGTGLVG